MRTPENTMRKTVVVVVLLVAAAAAQTSLELVSDGNVFEPPEETLAVAVAQHTNAVHDLLLAKQELVRAQATVDTAALRVEMERMRCVAAQATKSWWQPVDDC